jgi:hypothetical protein
MAKIDWTNEVWAVAAGGIDEGMAYWDEQSGRSGAFKTALDWGRVAMVLLGGAGVMLNRFETVAKPILTSGTTLLTKSAISAIRGAIKSPAAAHTSVGRRVHISQTPGAGFENIKPLY